MTFNSKYHKRLQTALPLVIGMVGVVALAYWGGLPERNRGLFLVGVGSLLLMLGLVLLLGWVLLVKPSGQGQALATTPLKASYRQGLALTISSLSIIVGGFWDEVWHRQYGVPFGQDFFWRPHLMMYFGLSLIIILTLLSLGALRRQPGSWLARLRSNPTVAYLTLLSAFLFYVLPADPAWHFIYGEDLSAWSLPHIFLAASFAFVSITAVATLLTTLEPRRWRRLRLTPQDALITSSLALALTILLQLMTTEWDTLRFVPAGSPSIFWQRPEWLLPAAIAFIATFIGTLANHATRRVGCATATGGAALGLRLALLYAFDAPLLSADAWLVSLVVLVAVDVAAVWRLQGYRGRNHKGQVRTGAPTWWFTSLLASLSMMTLGLFLVSQLFIYPEVTLRTLPTTLLSVGAVTLFASWTATRLGDTLAVSHKQGTRETPSRAFGWLTPAGLGLMLGFIVFYIGTATPPV